MNRLPYRVLIVDDTVTIHEDYRKILVPPERDPGIVASERMLFGNRAPETAVPHGFRLTFATQGEDALALAATAMTAGDSFSVAFVDVRMPPGIDGIETARRLWGIDPDLQIVICSAYSDVAWPEMAAQFGAADRWVILKKPFESVEVLQLAHALTEKWTLRRQTKAQMTELERTVAERTADLKSALRQLREEVIERERQEQERHAMERKLEEIQRVESLGVLAGGVAHDFNNILTGILMSASLARLGATSGTELYKQLLLIEENTRRAAGLCEQMLTYAGKSRVDPHALDLNSLVGETLELLHASIPKDAEFSIELMEALPAIMGDASRLRQVFMNLVLNAVEALGPPPRRIRLASGRQTLTAADLSQMAHPGKAGPGEFVYIEVNDTGLGMPPEIVHRIFEPFYTTKFTGRGLGLCSVLGIIRGHRGALHVASAPGTGTTFQVYLPAVAIAPAQRIPATSATLPTLRGTVLIADDEESVRLAAAAVLKRLGLTVVHASDGEAAVAAATHEPQPLIGVLLDVTMPRMDGLTALVALRNKLPEVPVILMTGFHAGELNLHRQLAGQSRVTILQKPFTVNALMDMVTQEFARPSASTSASA